MDEFAIALGLVYYMKYPDAEITRRPTIDDIPLGALLRLIAACFKPSSSSLDLRLIFCSYQYARGNDSFENRRSAAVALSPFLDAILYMIESLTGASVVALDLCGNVFTGPLPSALATFTGLTMLNLSGNKFSGSIPSWIACLGNLTYLDLFANQLDGALPAGLGALRNLQCLNLNDNRFSGKIPAALWQLKKLKSLCLAGNNFSGQLSSGIENLADLEFLNLSNNKFSGKLPCSVHTLNKLKTFYFDNSGLEV